MNTELTPATTAAQPPRWQAEHAEQAKRLLAARLNKLLLEYAREIEGTREGAAAWALFDHADDVLADFLLFASEESART